jgi:hypothetical protein
MSGSSLVETRAFRGTASRFFNDDEVEGLIDYLSQMPRAGKEISAIRGIRLLTWPLRELGREPLATVVYYYLDRRSSVHLIGCFSRETKAPASLALELVFEVKT